jgi:transcriptional regulator with XRE-family HTH domain
MPIGRAKLSDEIRLAIDASGMSRYRVCKEIGLPESTLSRFMSGQGGLAVKTLDKIADLLDLHITAGKGRRKKG